jgi:tRNA(Ile)-lysidine synthase
MRSGDDHSPILASDAKRLFADWKTAPAIVLAVSGGPDSIALMWLAARWRRALARGPRLIAVTVDHGLRSEAAREARDVKRLAQSLELPHRTLRWTDVKPKAGLPAAARAARYRLLAQAARATGATHILTAHTRDDQAETFLMRMLRGSGIAGLAAMARETERNGVLLARPLLDVSKSQLIATLKKAKIDFADDPTNRDPNFTRPRLRSLMPALAAEGGDARSLARLASRLARANAAVEVLVDGAERYLALRDRDARQPGFDAKAFAAMPEEIRLRLLLRAINRCGHEGPAELGKVETLLAALDRTAAGRRAGSPSGLKQTLAGALVSLVDGRIRVGPAPPRRRRAN